jgi:hypothetical protein
VQFIQGDAILPHQLGMPAACACSVDDAVGNFNVEAQGHIVDIESTKHLENQSGLNRKSTFRTDMRQDRQSFIIDSTDPESCPVYFKDNKSPAQTYTFTATKARPFTIIPNSDVKRNLASWSSGGGNPTKATVRHAPPCQSDERAA